SQVTEEKFESFKKSTPLAETPFGGQAHDWDLPLQFHNSVWSADRTVAFLEEHDSNQPFLLAVGFEDPHHPHAVPLEFEDRVRPEDVPLPDFTEGELNDKPPHFVAAREGRLEELSTRGEYAMAGQGAGFDFSKVSERDARTGRAYYYTMCRLIDREMGRILDALDRTGQAQNTIVIFTTDHGELLGDHGLWMKGPFHYDQLINVPCIVRWPDRMPGGQSIHGLFSHADIVPTLLAAAGVESDGISDGVDALPLLRGESESVRDDLLVECIDDPIGLRLKTLVTPERKLTWYTGQSYGELYDLESDPAEKINRWNDPQYAEEKSELLGRLLDYGETLEPRSERHCYA
ncbi:MAG: sulfatase-like hydrolase/transferase, partial [Planctomycetota bacterium]|nr:sulfatase-like hydrolase/transferase [Planctomycetota bacterium]